MRIVNLKLRKIRITSFSPRDGQVELEVSFDDGKLKQFHKAARIDNPASLAEEIITEIRTITKSTHQKFDGEHFLDSTVNIVFMDEEEVTKKVAKFLTRVIDKVDQVQRLKVADGYLDAIARVRSMRLEFD
jgi:acylphosphatase